MKKKNIKNLFVCFTVIAFSFALLCVGLFSTVSAAGISSAQKYAWSDNEGYINFENVIVNDTALSGYAWSGNSGWIRMNPDTGGVVNDGHGNLSGYAWGEKLGWINFDNVSIDANGRFSGTATGDMIGIINFECPNYCNVITDWREPVESSGSGSSGGSSGNNANNQNPFPDDINNNLGNLQNSLQSNFQNNLTAEDFLASVAGDNAAGNADVPALFDILSEPGTQSGSATENTRVDTSNAGVVVKVAPGELLPVSVKLLNFGGGKKVDVLVKYSIADESGREIYQSEETVAVETTASFVKTILIPFSVKPGVYTAKTAIIYAGQLVPATTQFPFTVERKILGIFQSTFILYSGITAFIALAAGFWGYTRIRKRNSGRFSPLDYSDIPKDQRSFYELISDTVMNMRQRVGDEAIEIANHTPGLHIDEHTGRVLKLDDKPSKIIASLVGQYEKALGKKVSFSFRKT